MARIIRTENTPAKTRNACMRSCAEVLRLLALRMGFDDEARDMTAFVIVNLRRIYCTIDDSAQVWEERRYWKKAEALRERWRWSRITADKLDALVRKEHWDQVPEELVGLIPHFQGITVTTITRNSDWWCGALQALLSDNPSRSGDALA